MSGVGSGGERPEQRGDHRDQEEFQEDPRSREEVSDQQPETQPAEEGDRESYDAPENVERDQVGRDDPSESSGNPPNAG